MPVYKSVKPKRRDSAPPRFVPCGTPLATEALPLLYLENKTTIKEVAKLFQLVALLLVAAVLGRSQCLAFCALASCDRPAKSSQPAKQEMPCHREGAPSKSQPPTGGPCSHHEIVAEKGSIGPSLDRVQSSQLVVDVGISILAPAVFRIPVNADQERFPSRPPAKLTSVLRI